jgi:hypothetical protein
MPRQKSIGASKRSFAFQSQHEQWPHVRIDPTLKEVVLPDEEGQQCDADHARGSDLVGEERLPSEHRKYLHHDAEAG